MNKNNLFFILSFLWFVSNIINAQVGINTEDPNEHSALDIENLTTSSGIEYKGVLIPRMTETERNAITAGLDAAALAGINSLLVFNTTENCYNYFNAKYGQWVSLCGSYGDAEFTGPSSADCGQIRIYGIGTYYANVGLSTFHYIVIPINVTVPGSYTIVAMSNNGYSFSATGVFPDTGLHNVTLQGTGTPVNAGTDNITFLNGQTPLLTTTGEAVCTKQIEVKSTIVSYEPVCDNIQINGTYSSGVALDATNFVSVPIIVSNDGQISISTNTNNGVTFSVTQNITTDSLFLNLKGIGIPTRAGAFTYVFTTNGANPQTCSFSVVFDTTLGSFENPAKCCYDIYKEDNTLPDGDNYWIRAGNTTGDADTPVRTYCDMTNGGYTLVWSYSELTAYNTYPGTGMMVNSNYNLNKSTGVGATGINVVTTENTNINYNNYRLSFQTMSSLKTSDLPLYKVRIANNATDMNDDWGLNNYVIISPTEKRMDPLTSTTAYNYFTPTQGKLYGLDVNITRTSRKYGTATLGNAAFYTTDGGVFSNHYDFGNSIASGDYLFTVIPEVPAGQTGTLRTINLNNIFGYFGEAQSNHHWGKCGGVNGSETDFVTRTCDTTLLYPHTSINSGEGRILQWFIK